MTRIRAVFLSTPGVLYIHKMVCRLHFPFSMNTYYLPYLTGRFCWRGLCFLLSDLMERALLPTANPRLPSTLILLPKRAVGGVRDVYTLDCVHSVRKFSPIGYVIAAELDHLWATPDIIRTSLWRIPPRTRGTRFDGWCDTTIAPDEQGAKTWQNHIDGEGDENLSCRSYCVWFRRFLAGPVPNKWLYSWIDSGWKTPRWVLGFVQGLRPHSDYSTWHLLGRPGRLNRRFA